jgi:putative ABC transport system permease protein
MSPGIYSGSLLSYGSALPCSKIKKYSFLKMNFLIITCRRLAKEKFYALVCVLSLALGFACSILISLFLLSEMTFDMHHQNHERIYRVSTRFGDLEIPATGYDIGPLLVRDNPQFLNAVRVRGAFEKSFTYGDNSSDWEEVFHIDASAFDVFTLTPLLGDNANAFEDPYSIAISESFAQYYFGDNDPIGELINTERLELRVSLVFEDLPENVSQRFDALLPFDLVEFYQPDWQESFGLRFQINSNVTYLYVADSFDPQSFAAASDYLFETYMATEFSNSMGAAVEFHLLLDNLSDIHFINDLMFGEGAGDIANLYIFAAVAITLLLISCINYVNLATARATVRVKEVAMRKIAGASSRHLILQFLAESVVFIGLAFGIGILLSILAIYLGYVEAFTGKADLSSLLLTPIRLLQLLLLGLAVSVLSGLYPAFQLTRQSMMSVLKPPQKSWRLGLPQRQLLVLLQMVASVIIVSCVFIMLQQSNFLAQAPLGFKKENQLVTRIRGAEAIRSREAIVTELSRHNEILSVLEMGGSLGRSLSISILDVENNLGEDVSVTTNNFSAGVGFLDTLEIELLEGKMFRAEQADTDSTPILVNETFVKQMEWTEALGKRVGGNEVIGVIKDFHYRPLHEPIAPVFIAPYSDSFLDDLDPSRLERVPLDFTIKVTGNNTAATRDYIRQVIAQFSNQPIIEIRTMTEIWNGMYDDESQTIALVGIFGAICIVISLLGLAGLAAYSTQQRAKEVAIRKVLGASVPNIIGLLSLNMVKVFALATVPAIVAAYYLSNAWLQRFSYRAEFSATPYLLAIALVGSISVAVLVLQTYRTAQANPVTRLKYE